MKGTLAAAAFILLLPLAGAGPISPQPWTSLKDTSKSSTLSARKIFDCEDGDGTCNYVSSCGSEWMPLNDWKDDNGAHWHGYRTRVEKFCRHGKVSGATVPAGDYLSMYFPVSLNGGKDKETHRSDGVLEFEIHNKQDEDHKVNEVECIGYLTTIRLPNARGARCYGSNSDNDDTKGGTFQAGDDAVSYHALATRQKLDNLPSEISDLSFYTDYEGSIPMVNPASENYPF